MTTPTPPALLPAIDRVLWFDWSSNDADAVAAIEALRAARRATPAPDALRAAPSQPQERPALDDALQNMRDALDDVTQHNGPERCGRAFAALDRLEDAIDARTEQPQEQPADEVAAHLRDGYEKERWAEVNAQPQELADVPKCAKCNDRGTLPMPNPDRLIPGPSRTCDACWGESARKPTISPAALEQPQEQAGAAGLIAEARRLADAPDWTSSHVEDVLRRIANALEAKQEQAVAVTEERRARLLAEVRDEIAAYEFGREPRYVDLVRRLAAALDEAAIEAAQATDKLAKHFDENPISKADYAYLMKRLEEAAGLERERAALRADLADAHEAQVAQRDRAEERATVAESDATQWRDAFQASEAREMEYVRAAMLALQRPEGGGKREMILEAIKRAEAAEGEAGRLRVALEAELADRIAHARHSTHWNGCESAHPQCAAIERLRAALAAKEGK